MFDAAMLSNKEKATMCTQADDQW